MKAAFGTVVYKMAHTFYKDYINAVNHQDTKDFDVLLLNDNLDDETCVYLTHRIKQRIIWAHGTASQTIPELKIELIKSAKDKEYDLLILGDFDDSFSENRVSKHILNYDSGYSFYYNELYTMNQLNRFFCMLPRTVEDINPILECNLLGFSNTALNMNAIDYNLLNSLTAKQTIAFDWMVFSLLLLAGHKGKKIEDCITYYRIHEHNIAGETDNSAAGLEREIEIKIAHYAKLADVDLRYADLYKFYTDLKNSFTADSLIEKSIINNHYWWGRIKKDNFLKR